MSNDTTTTTRTPADLIWVDPERPATLSLRGEIDLDTVSQFCGGIPTDESLADVARTLAERGVRRVDARAVTFADSALLVLLCELATAVGRDRFRVEGCPPALALVIALTDTEELFDLTA